MLFTALFFVFVFVFLLVFLFTFLLSTFPTVSSNFDSFLVSFLVSFLFSSFIVSFTVKLTFLVISSVFSSFDFTTKEYLIASSTSPIEAFDLTLNLIVIKSESFVKPLLKSIRIFASLSLSGEPLNNTNADED